MGVVAVPPASAIEVAGFSVRIDVDQDGGVCGTVKDSATNANYTAVLTATGFESEVAASGVILDVATGSGNPAKACISGGFTPSAATSGEPRRAAVFSEWRDAAAGSDLDAESRRSG